MGCCGSNPREGAWRTAFGIPAYGYPTIETELWAAFAGLGPDTVIVVDPDSGPGTDVDPNYIDALEPLRGQLQLYGYVDVAYGARPLLDVQADIDAWVNLYGPLQGIFFDQAPATDGDVAYLAQVAEMAHSIGLRVAFNPGQPAVANGIFDVADHVITFEGDVGDYGTITPPSGIARRKKVWHLVYGVADEETMVGVVAQSRTNRAHMLFVQSEGLPNPWDHLPPYWDAEVVAVQPSP